MGRKSSDEEYNEFYSTIYDGSNKAPNQWNREKALLMASEEDYKLHVENFELILKFFINLTIYYFKLKLEFALKRGLVFIDHITITKTNDGRKEN